MGYEDLDGGIPGSNGVSTTAVGVRTRAGPNGGIAGDFGLLPNQSRSPVASAPARVARASYTLMSMLLERIRVEQSAKIK